MNLNPQAEHGTLVADTVKTESFSGATFEYVEVLNRSTTSSDVISVAVGETATAGDVTDPAVLGDDVWVVPAGQSRVFELPGVAAGVTVKMKSATTPAYSVTAW